jgi:hypothetical protein
MGSSGSSASFSTLRKPGLGFRQASVIPLQLAVRALDVQPLSDCDPRGKVGNVQVEVVRNPEEVD